MGKELSRYCPIYHLIESASKEVDDLNPILQMMILRLYFPPSVPKGFLEEVFCSFGDFFVLAAL